MKKLWLFGLLSGDKGDCIDVWMVCEFNPHRQTWYQKFIGTYLPLHRGINLITVCCVIIHPISSVSKTIKFWRQENDVKQSGSSEWRLQFRLFSKQFSKLSRT